MRHHARGLDAPAPSNPQAEAAVVVDQVQKPEPPGVGGVIEWEIYGRGHLIAPKVFPTNKQGNEMIDSDHY